ncbi:MAG: zinc/manganese transport system substrate-binding protein [Actinomycetota bacterium]|nr:zinc/manganese transport system substrate-binding protein [Actinomycetota bacterium]
MSHRRPLRTLLLFVTLSVALGATACGGTSSGTAGGPGDRPQIVVTYPVLAAVVRQVAGDGAEVTTLMPNGADPHEWSPSAKDVQKLLGADLVVHNGLGLENTLQKHLEKARKDGVAVFAVADHVTVRTVKAGEGAEADDPDQAPGAKDPHLWMDPLTMKQWIGPLVPALRTAGVTSASATATEADLQALDRDITTIVQTVPPARRKLVTGHESLGYFAERYGFQLIGAVIPSITSQAEASAGRLAELTKKIKEAGVPAVFTELGTPTATAESIGRDSGAKVVELSTHVLPADGTYRTFMLDLTHAVAGALT